MPQDRRNIYKIAREARGLTQEAAAEKLGISDSSIRAYETGQRIPPNEVVDLMVIAYDSQLLGIQHIRASAEMARSIIPDVQEMTLSQAAMEVLDQIYGFVDAHRDRDMIRICKDDIVDDEERPLHDQLMEDLSQLEAAVMAYRYARKKDALAVRYAKEEPHEV